MKVNWVKNAEKDPLLAELAKRSLDPDLGEEIWEANLKEDDIGKVFRPSFWSDVLQAWARVHFREPKNSYEVLNQKIWYNSLIRANNVPLMYKSAHREGLTIIAQLIMPEGRFIPHELLCPMYSLTKMEYNVIVSAIPKSWKKLIANTENIDEICNRRWFPLVYEVKHEQKTVQWYYKKVNEDKENLAKMFNKWQQRFGGGIEFCDYENAVLNINRITNFSKMRSFQYRLLSCALVFNKHLYAWGLVNTNKCVNCQVEKETMEHVFYSCNTAQKIWNEFRIFCKKNYDTSVNLERTNVLLSTVNQEPTNVTNFLSIIDKNQMYAYRCMQKEISFPAIEQYVDKCRRYEYYNAKTKQKLKYHYKKCSKRAYDSEKSNVLDALTEDVQEHLYNISMC